MTFKHISFTL